MSGPGAALRAVRIAGLALAVLARRRALRPACAAGLEVLGIRVEAEGPPPPPGALLASNHLSYLDPIVLLALVPCVPISKAEVAGWPLLGAAARTSGVLFVRRGDVTSGLEVKRAAQRLLEEGQRVLNFPEGTTTAGDEVLPFRPGLFGTAHRAGAPVVPVALSYDPPGLAWTGDDTFLPHLLRVAGRPGAVARVRFGTPVPARAWPDATTLAHAVRARVLDLRGGAPCRKTLP